MNTENYDVIIIGGGINGVGIAQAAAANGYRCLLLEKNPALAMETSSCSSKLIHGGLRYLESFEFSLVRESLKERELLLQLAPELVKLQTFNIPVYHDTSRSSFHLHMGLSLYCVLSGLRKNTFYRQLKPSRFNEKTFEGLTFDHLKTVFQYYDAQTDDVALTRAVMASATNLGAEWLCNAEFIQANVESSNNRVEVEYKVEGIAKTVTSSVLINASGPWVSRVNQCVFPIKKIPEPDLVQGTHMVVKTPVKQAYYLESPSDKRAVFLLPWKNNSLLGTTEHLFKDDPSNLQVLEQEKNYLMDIYQHYFPGHEKKIISTMTGARVLPAADNALSKRSRETVFEVDNESLPRVLSVVGGKLTVYRKTAEKVLQRLAPSLPEKIVRVHTNKLKLTPVD